MSSKYFKLLVTLRCWRERIVILCIVSESLYCHSALYLKALITPCVFGKKFNSEKTVTHLENDYQICLFSESAQVHYALSPEMLNPTTRSLGKRQILLCIFSVCTKCLTRIASGESYGDLAQRKIDYWRTNEVKNLKKIANPQALSIEYFVFSSCSLKFSHYIV